MTKMLLRRTSCLALLLTQFVSANAYAQPTPYDTPVPEPEVPAPVPALPPVPTAETPISAPSPEQPVDPPVRVAPTVPPPVVMPPTGPTIWGPAVGRPMTSVPRWYGLPAAIAFGASDTFMIVGLVAGDGKLAGAAMQLALITHGLAGPINHWAHGHVGRGFASLGLNAGIPAFMLLPGVFFTLASKSETPLIVAPLLGELVFNAIDVAVLSNDEEKLPWIPPKGARALLPSSVAVVPMLDPKRLGIALVGQF